MYSSLFESQYFKKKKKLFRNKLCKFIQYTRNFTHLKKHEHFCFDDATGVLQRYVQEFLKRK